MNLKDFSLKTFLILITLANSEVLTAPVVDNICSNTSVINSVIHSQIDPNIVYLFINKTVFTLNVENTDRAVLTSIALLQDWDKDIQSPINYAYTTKSDPNYLELTNCDKGVEKDWVIRIPDHKLVATLSSDSHCIKPTNEWVLIKHLNFVAGTEAHPGSFYFNLVNDLAMIDGRKQIVSMRLMLESKGSDDKEIRREKRPDIYIKLVNIRDQASIDRSLEFGGIIDQRMDAAFIHGNQWFLFAGHRYCKLELNNYSYTKCEPRLVADWIGDCVDGELPSELMIKNTDISIYLIILVIIIALGVIVLIVVLMSIRREVTSRKKGSST